MSNVMLAFLVAFTIVHIVMSQPQLPASCNSVVKNSCKTDIECACSGPTRLICNYKKECNKISLFDIMFRVPCPGIFKSSCKTDDDCPCASRKLACEDNECVKAKSVLALN